MIFFTEKARLQHFNDNIYKRSSLVSSSKTNKSIELFTGSVPSKLIGGALKVQNMIYN